MIEADKYTHRMLVMQFRIFKKDRVAGSPEREALRVLVEGKQGKHWIGVLFDQPRHAKHLKRGCGIWLRAPDVEASRRLTAEEASELAALTLQVLATGKGPLPSN